MITQNKKAKGVVIKALLTLPLFALLLFANCKSNDNNKVSDKNVVELTETVASTGIDDSPVYNEVEVQPEYPGGMQAMFGFIQKNVKYPESAKEKGIEGKVYVQFVVEKDGSLSSFKVARGVSDDIDAEAIRVVKAMPKWTPGMQDGKPVRVQFMLPFVFKLNGNENTMTALSGTKWEGKGEGTKDGVKYVMEMTMDFYNNDDGLFVMKLTSQEKGKEPVVQFSEVGLDFKYVYDGNDKAGAGAISPKNPDGSTLGEEDQLPYIYRRTGDKIVVEFYDFKEDCGIENITFVKK